MITYKIRKGIASCKYAYLLLICCLCGSLSLNAREVPKPKIVNIVNFIRLLEPRDPKITEQVLYETVVHQLNMMRQYRLGGTFLLQYDALMDGRYQRLLSRLPKDSFEIGAWWEIPQPLVEKAGLAWRGRYPWDWHADIGFSTGYTPRERELLADVYMADFKKIFGYYPKSVGSWFIDSHTLNYLYEKYHIVASSNCKDQVGTDGYTLWGGYWNQAYYPSRINSYMPAQTIAKQLPVPIFRMLGSDPIRQYDNGLGRERQGVVTLEPVYPEAGGDSTWVHWYFRQFVQGESMEYGYVQAGQENSFTWDAMAKGFEWQMPLIARLRDEHKIRVETLAESGAWFRKHYALTPATSVTVMKDLPGSDRRTVWYNSRYYRINWLWEKGNLMIRDIHLFDENFPSVYTEERATSNECSFFTLPFVDSYVWSSKGELAGMRLKMMKDGKEVLLEGGEPRVVQKGKSTLHISWPLKNVKGSLEIDLRERGISMKITGVKDANWFLELRAAETVRLPFEEFGVDRIGCRFEGMEYEVRVRSGKVEKLTGGFKVKSGIGGIGLEFGR